MLRIRADGGASLTCFAAAPASGPLPPSPGDWKRLRQDLKLELADELKSQMASLAKGMVSELRAELFSMSPQHPRLPSPREPCYMAVPSSAPYLHQPSHSAAPAPVPYLHPPSQDTTPSRLPMADQFREDRQAPVSYPRRPSQSTTPAQPPAANRFQYDEQGRPICNQCRIPGHIQRFCPRRRTQSTPQLPLN